MKTDFGVESIFAFIIRIVSISAIIAALMALNISLPIKVLLLGFLLFFYSIWYRLGMLENQINRLLYFIRCNYITNETQRLDPENKTPARDILVEDIRSEEAMEECAGRMGLGRIFGIDNRVLSLIFEWIFEIVMIVIGTVVIYKLLK